MHFTVAVCTRVLKKLLLIGAISFCFCKTATANNLPPKPDTYFFDPSHLVSSTTANQLNRQLAQFERDTSNQVLVAIFPDLPEGEALEDFTQRTAEAWGVGQKNRSNGVVLFIFVKPRKIRIEVGYGLEGVLPDITARRIIAQEITPAFKTGNFAAGITRGISAIFAAIRGEYRGTGSTIAEKQGGTQSDSGETAALVFFGIIIVGFLIMLFRNKGGGHVYGPLGKSSTPGPFWIPPLGKRRSDDDDDNDGFGGGFRGGGGSFGGGGASGGW